MYVHEIPLGEVASRVSEVGCSSHVRLFHRGFLLVVVMCKHGPLSIL
jgi:hypothetical protein